MNTVAESIPLLQRFASKVLLRNSWFTTWTIEKCGKIIKNRFNGLQTALNTYKFEKSRGVPIFFYLCPTLTPTQNRNNFFISTAQYVCKQRNKANHDPDPAVHEAKG